jgi:iron-sulfur cluster repair protein YtfE (RIC family)
MMLDTNEMDEIVTILEEMEDEELAASLLKDLNDRTQKMGSLLMNRDPSLSTEDWKKLCDEAKAAVDDLLKHIKSL